MMFLSSKGDTIVVRSDDAGPLLQLYDDGGDKSLGTTSKCCCAGRGLAWCSIILFLDDNSVIVLESYHSIDK